MVQRQEAACARGRPAGDEVGHRGLALPEVLSVGDGHGDDGRSRRSWRSIAFQRRLAIGHQGSRSMRNCDARCGVSRTRAATVWGLRATDENSTCRWILLDRRPGLVEKPVNSAIGNRRAARCRTG